ncbi:hypothetical protein D1872_255370 [compost metagenome]
MPPSIEVTTNWLLRLPPAAKLPSFSRRIFFFWVSTSSASDVKPGARIISRKISFKSRAVASSTIRFAATMPPKIETGSASYAFR